MVNVAVNVMTEVTATDTRHQKCHGARNASSFSVMYHLILKITVTVGVTGVFQITV